jgi:transcription-repair coupling factor (superfamily II helicase)
LAVVGEQDLLGERIARPPRRRRSASQFIADATGIEQGDLVVHQDHGIGRYDGIETISVGSAPHDCLRLIYDGGDKLFLPVENIEVLSRFGSEGQGVALDKLGGASWQNRKAKAKQRIQDMAAQLIRVAAERKVKEGVTAIPPEGAWDEFCARFPFAETDDQQRAIAKCWRTSPRQAMDRLVCGDVGFGKTEVALRAAFCVAMSGSPGAVVVPTTLLSRQHTRTFTARFEGLPVQGRPALPHGYRRRKPSPCGGAEIRRHQHRHRHPCAAGLRAWSSPTSAWSSWTRSSISASPTRNASSSSRPIVHVLTLTATPIPRTLQLALTGVREMSIIATPPVDRLAVRTFIMPWDGVVLREASSASGSAAGRCSAWCRGWRTCPRFGAAARDRARGADRGGARAPVRDRARTGDDRVRRRQARRAAFHQHRGERLDMPAVNTLLIHRADMFGWRSSTSSAAGRARQAAGLRLPHLAAGPPPLAAAQKRLEVMQTLDTLGAGFTLASHDLDIRGAGNLLGDEQSGQVREVGIELYQQMLEDAVADIRAGQGKKRAPTATTRRTGRPNINLGLPVLIPEDYVRDLPVRLGLYRRIAAWQNEAEIEAVAAELEDRFGKLPPEVENLLQVVAVKRLCREAGVEKVDAGPKGVVLSFRRNQFRNPGGLVSWVGAQKGLVKLRPDHKLALLREMELPQRVRVAKDLLSGLVKLAAQAKAA